MWYFLTVLSSLALIQTGHAHPYEVPLTKVQESPFESIAEYPIQGNNFKVNEKGTHVFWPMDQKLYSKFYMNMRYENQKFYGFSQQLFGIQRTQNLFPDVITKVAGNDHVAFVKAEGTWKDHYSTETEDGLDFESENIRVTRVQSKLRLLKLFSWFAGANIGKLVQQQSHVPAQLPQLKNQSYTNESVLFESQLREDMKDFSEGITHEHYHNFEKSALMCFHMDIDGIVPSKNGELDGWWLPLRHNILAWRAMNLQEPMSKHLVTFGQVAISVVPDSDILTVVYKGGQLFRADMEGINFQNTKLYMAPPNDMSDTRLPAPQKPSWWLQWTIGNFLWANPSNTHLPWASREKLCAESKFESKVNKVAEACPNIFSPSLTCMYQFVNFYPCFNYMVRSSKKYSHGIDGLAEFTALIHATAEAPWSLIKTLASDKPWDEEFETAIELLGLDPTA